MMTMLLMLVMMTIVIPSSVLGTECYECSTLTGDKDCVDPFDKSKDVKTCTKVGTIDATGCAKAKFEVDGQLTILQSLYYVMQYP